MKIDLISKNRKFAVICLSGFSSRLQPDRIIKITENITIYSGSPFSLSNHWEKWIGSINAEKVKECNFSIIVQTESKNLEVLDSENEHCINEARNLYSSMIFTSPFMTDSPALVFSGSKIDENVDIRSFATLENYSAVPGTPDLSFDEAKTVRTSEVYKNLTNFLLMGKHSRLLAGFKSYLNGFEAISAEDRLHAYVRTIEAFIYPDIGSTKKQFKSRTELFIGSKLHERMGIIYHIRSNIEHLHHPIEGIGPLSTQTYREMFIQIEYLARSMIYTFLTNQNVWPHFEDEELQKFWNQSDEFKRKTWSWIFDIEEYAKEISHPV